MVKSAMSVNIGSLKSKLNVVIVIKLFFIKNLKHIEIGYQLY